MLGIGQIFNQLYNNECWKKLKIWKCAWFSFICEKSSNFQIIPKYGHYLMISSPLLSATFCNDTINVEIATEYYNSHLTHHVIIFIIFNGNTYIKMFIWLFAIFTRILAFCFLKLCLSSPLCFSHFSFTPFCH
jgi:hypothetical protein